MIARSVVVSFWYWWLAELKTLVPARLRQLFAVRPPRYSIFCDGQGFCILDTRRPIAGEDIHLLEHYDDPLAVVRALKDKLGKSARRRSIGIVVPASRCLVRQISVPVASLPHLKDMLALDIVRLVPGGAQGVLSGNTRVPAGGAENRIVTQYIVKENLVEPVLSQAEEQGLTVGRCSVVSQHGETISITRAAADEATEKSDRHTVSTRLLKAATAIALCILAGALYLAFDKQQRAIAHLQLQVDDARTQALWVRRQVERIAKSSNEVTAVHGKKLGTYRLMEIWEETTRILPDSAWVNSMSMKDGTVLISGFAKAAAELIAPLQASKLFEDASFASPVVMGPQRKKERFQIRLRLGERPSDGRT